MSPGKFDYDNFYYQFWHANADSGNFRRKMLRRSFLVPMGEGTESCEAGSSP
ncbi:hypothetical protein KIN20_016940 [Parelaphostrongylus tenuis]|uniref:Uncharacterized protein n=1 Tax=Parelaphostrongylus tenuis TaxID=148309 RepID=A0AAD5MH83_PARTN|nr:hypothetical protein KIN20_016940 [Parelaphostrongylus tenuis]